jgi:hypothetical protein
MLISRRYNCACALFRLCINNVLFAAINELERSCSCYCMFASYATLQTGEVGEEVPTPLGRVGRRRGCFIVVVVCSLFNDAFSVPQTI